jgi:hypothetical protein
MLRVVGGVLGAFPGATVQEWAKPVSETKQAQPKPLYWSDDEADEEYSDVIAD